jgi:hypothetical protein
MNSLDQLAIINHYYFNTYIDHLVFLLKLVASSWRSCDDELPHTLGGRPFFSSLAAQTI